MGAPVNKLLLPVLGEPLLAWTLLAASRAESIQWIALIAQAEDREPIRKMLDRLALKTPVHWIEGGSTRQESVRLGLAGLPGDAERVLIHDGARCLATSALFDRCAVALGDHPALVAAVPVRDTIKRVRSGSFEIEATVPREHLWAAQTPQGFALAPLRTAHRLAQEESLAVTDDAALCEWQGIPVVVVPGEETNVKITARADLLLAEAILTARHNKERMDLDHE